MTTKEITRPFKWLNALNLRSLTWTRQRPAAIEASPVAHPQVMVAPSTLLAGQAIKLPRRLDASCYQEVIGAAQQLYSLHGPYVELDLSGVEQIELAGFFALHCVVLVTRGETPPDPEYGWHALREVCQKNLAAGRQEQLKAVNPSAKVEAQLRANQLDRCLVIEQRGALDS
jgi:hypothetical protein